MKDIKAHIFQKLSGDTNLAAIVGSNIHCFVDDSYEMQEFSTRFPQITYARISGVTNDIGVRLETFQISSWAETMRQAEDMNTLVVNVFNRTQDDTYKHARVTHIDDTYDPDTKTFGIHATISFVIQDNSY